MTETAPITIPAIYAAINRMAAELAEDGIKKSNENKQQGYKFRGIEDVFAAIAPLLAKHHLCILPRMLSHKGVDRPSKSGGLNIFSVIEAEFDIVSTLDGSKHTVRTIGEGMDTADKSSNKAMSAAYKYAVLLAFAVPTRGVAMDGDEETGEGSVPAEKAEPKKPKPSDDPWDNREPFHTVEHAVSELKYAANDDHVKIIWNRGKHLVGSDMEAFKKAITERREGIVKGVQPATIPF